ncbi:unnamed protein product [Parnassius apollo]|uniref:(apollo) hypothetical protein n=1 Tax=Parnassius apollo TaxID=110799 RepID=A0A8S3XSH3_PARAO|nr:unnamed protein product [Parnassius apollo]
MLLLKQQIPDLLTQVPLRGIALDYKGELKLHLHEECFMAGYHFFYKGDKVRDGKFLLQRNLRIQFLQIGKKHLWCDKIMYNFQEGIGQFGFSGYSDKESSICVRDVDRAAQPCHPFLPGISFGGGHNEKVYL